MFLIDFRSYLEPPHLLIHRVRLGIHFALPSFLADTVEIAQSLPGVPTLDEVPIAEEVDVLEEGDYFRTGLVDGADDGETLGG